FPTRPSFALRYPYSTLFRSHLPLRFTVAVAGSDVQQVDPGVDRLPDGRRGLLASGRSPDLTHTAAAEREYADLSDRAQCPALHRHALLSIEPVVPGSFPLRVHSKSIPAGA